MQAAGCAAASLLLGFFDLSLGVSPEPSHIARAHMVQAVVRLLATLILMGVVIAGYEALKPVGFFGCIAALALIHVLVSLIGRVHDEQP